MGVVANHPRKILGAGAIAMAVAAVLPLIKQEEGLRTVGYRDLVGVPTFCYGGTGRQAVVGRTYTLPACQTQVAQDALKHAQAIAPCIHVAIPPESFAAFISFSYNVGAGGFCRSSIVRHLNAGDLKDACAGLSAYVYAGGKRVQGLVNRRAQERALCERGVVSR